MFALNDLPDDLSSQPDAVLPCWTEDPDLFFAESPADVETAKALCVSCPLRARCLAEALERLPEHLRIPVVLRYFSGLAEREIAIAIQRRPGTVKSRLSEARRRLADDPALVAWTDVEVAR